MSTIEVAGKEVPRLGFGAMRVMGALGSDGKPDREASRALIRRAVELGARFIDTANIYGDGYSEEVIAEALHPYADDLLIATKGGLVGGAARRPNPDGRPNTDGRPDSLKQACEASLRRLRLDTIDLYQLHAPDPDVPFEESIGALIELRDEGKIRHIGLSNLGRRQIAAASALTPIASVQNRYNHDDRASEGVIDMCEEHGIAFLPWGPVQVGDDTAVAGVAEKHGVSTQQAALAWLLARSSTMLPIPGTSSIAHLEQNVAAADIALDPGDVELLNATAG
ncbi:MAG TPA: aldo/keto reductase [Acidimicrobiales bacterium]|jgi:aryl-alcohol dehydrogenase-like predicted oxidoreductase